MFEIFSRLPVPVTLWMGVIEKARVLCMTSAAAGVMGFTRELLTWSVSMLQLQEQVSSL